mmetsp:Transcript_11863/g.30431  ORF Transcript_11863/g.30431 Transcript_11863/m.30431 type:complete len:249 (+) Transcript_11863:289-1035(+)|eukprot:CAMPEP_0115854070 /NCGR_PEP_ID=MMETSP0287-20121206/13832_1 /TAXON_ID=412157 /ORGANISM="Chrysochromulina rotalis, Strain UIO044" /LENGTH=248 /DNA_ID=CAMNT_0003308171 /DNA_START=268 /DNA_END=1014 /DNA_ORIENTATION=-
MKLSKFIERGGLLALINRNSLTSGSGSAPLCHVCAPSVTVGATAAAKEMSELGSRLRGLPAVLAPALRCAEAVTLVVWRKSHHLILCMNPDDEVDTLATLERQRRVELAAEMEDSVTRLKLREVDEARGHRPRLGVDAPRAPKRERAPCEALNAQVGVQSKDGGVCVLSKRHVLARLVADDKTIVLISVAVGDQPRVQHLPQRPQIPSCEVLKRRAEPKRIQNGAIAVHAVRPTQRNAAPFVVREFLQ